MILGILSDTHNHLAAARRALAALADAGAEGIVHCGDVGDDVMDLLSAECLERGVPAWVALGNCDGWGDATFRGRPAGIEGFGRQVHFEAGGKACAVLHGDDLRALWQLSNSGKLDYVFTGHTHRPELERAGNTVVLNPGSPARPRNGLATVAVLDTGTGEAKWIAVE